jgi:GntR family transcriptional regulator/MocR family aminotransferase
VVYLGTFSKTMLPALRIGFMIVPANLATEIGGVIGEMSRQGRVADQIALADFIESGKYARHLRRMRRIYQQRREAVVGAIDAHMRDLVTVSSDGSGMHLTMRLDAPLRDRDASAALREKGISVSPLSTYCHRGEDAERFNGFLLGYAAVRPDKADRLVAELAAAIRSLAASS